MAKHRKHKKRKNLRKTVTEWHKRIGLISAVVVILLSLTGILLNHTDGLGLDRSYISNSSLLKLYKVPEPQITNFALRETWLSASDSHIYLNGERLEACEGKLVGAIVLEEYWVLGCSEGIALFTPDNELIEVVDASSGLPLPINKIGICHPNACIDGHGNIHELDIEAMTWQTLKRRVAVDWSKPSKAPKNIMKAVTRKAMSEVISWEKLVLDIHAGRFLGNVGPWLLDLFALFCCFFAVTGIYIWNSKRK